MFKVNIPKGTRDFSHQELIIRNKIIEIIKYNFELFGFFPIETPAFEMLSTFNKVNENESYKLMFQVKTYNNNINIENISKQALRYDLTIPMIRYYIMHQENIFLPFKRYQIQPVWRAEKPQKGRFREFYQCDVDIINYSNSLWNEIELIKLYDKIFFQLGIPITIHINHRKILYGLSEIFGISRFFNDFIIILDKIEKIGIERFKFEIKKKIQQFIDLDKLLHIINFKGNFEEKLFFYKKNISEYGKEGIEDILFIYNNYKAISNKSNNLNINISLARGLNYYTGTIYEIKLKNVNDNNYNYSLGGGGRYDNLLNKFGIKNKFCVGSSFGLDRILLTLKKLELINKHNICVTQIMFINFGTTESVYSYKFIEILRLKSISVELYPNPIKIKKQIQYANNKKIKFLAIVGKNEINKKIIKIKNLQTNISIDYKNIEDFIKDNINFLN